MTQDDEKKAASARKKKNDGAGADAAGGNSEPQPAGPHADPALTDDTRTPGAGTLPDPEEDGERGDSITG